jgi:hypothetical protein
MPPVTSRTGRSHPPRAKGGAPSLPMPAVLYNGTARPEAVTVPARTVLALDGQGAPEGQRFQHSVGAIYGIAYTLKFARKKSGRKDFKVGPLEARWWTDEPARRFMDTPRDAWRWQLRIAMPKDATPAEVSRAVAQATHKKGGKLEGNAEAQQVALAVLPAERCGRVLHVGPYSREGESFAKIIEVVQDAGLAPRNSHLEVYLSDPRRTSPERLKTELLLELS